MTNGTHKNVEIDNKLTSAALYSNGYSSYIPWNTSMGFQTATLAYRQQEIRSSLAENFLINTHNMRNNPPNAYSILSFLDDRGMVMVSHNGKECNSESESIPLPEGVPLDLALGEAITQRRSKRSYTGDGCDLSYIASVIRAASGVSTKARVRLVSEGTANFYFRTVPSAGGLYPIEIYMAALNVEGLSKGIYRYYSLNDCLIQTGPVEKLNQLTSTFDVPDEIINLRYANAIFLLVAQPWKTMRKYGERGLRFVFHEAGAITQNIHLSVTALGLGSVDCASLYEDEIHEVLDLDGKFQSVVHSIIVGVSG